MIEGLKLQACLVGIIALVLLAIASIIVKAHNIVRFGSGLGSTEVLRRMWSKSDLVLFQPVRTVEVFAPLASMGLFFALREFVTAVLQLAGLMHHHYSPAQDIIFALCATVAAPFGLAVYSFGGGRNFAVVGSVIVCLFVGAAVVDFCYALLVEDNMNAFRLLAIVLLGPVGVVVASLRAKSQLTARETSVATVQTASPRPTFIYIWSVLVLTACRVAHIGTLFFAGGPGDHKGLDLHYLSRVAAQLSDVLLLMASALVAIAVTNDRVMNGNYSWQWPSFLVPALCVLPSEAIIALVLFGRRSDYFTIWYLVRNIIKVGGTGFVGSAAYLLVVAKYARAALDPGADGQSELLEIDDDEDSTSEFEI